MCSVPCCLYCCYKYCSRQRKSRAEAFQRGTGISRSRAFETDNAVIVHGIQRPRDGRIMYFARAWLHAPRYVGDLYFTNGSATALYQLDQIAFADLSVIQIK